MYVSFCSASSVTDDGKVVFHLIVISNEWNNEPTEWRLVSDKQTHSRLVSSAWYDALVIYLADRASNCNSHDWNWNNWTTDMLLYFPALPYHTISLVTKLHWVRILLSIIFCGKFQTFAWAVACNWNVLWHLWSWSPHRRIWAQKSRRQLFTDWSE